MHPDKLDITIQSAVQSIPHASRLRREKLWAELQQQIKMDHNLSTLAEPVPSYSEIIIELGKQAWQTLTQVLNEETRYERAYYDRNRAYNGFPFVDRSFSLKVFDPLHYKWVYPM